MKVTLKEGTRVVYERRTNQITVDIDYLKSTGTIDGGTY